MAIHYDQDLEDYRIAKAMSRSKKTEENEPTAIHYIIASLIVISLLVFGIYFISNKIKEKQEKNNIKYILNEIEEYKEEYKNIEFLNSDYMKNRKHKKAVKTLKEANTIINRVLESQVYNNEVKIT